MYAKWGVAQWLFKFILQMVDAKVQGYKLQGISSLEWYEVF